METRRLRVEFDQVLSKLQKTQSLKRCWILLKPHHRSISDLSDYIIHSFNLRNDCPNGLLLSMEDFALPPFESTSILKDNDIIRVEKNGGACTEIVMVGGDANELDVVEIVETQPVVGGMNLLANEEFEKESGGYQSEEEDEEEDDELKQVENAVHVDNSPEVKALKKKRKASKELESPKSKTKKTKSASAEKCVLAAKDSGNKVCGKGNGTLKTAKVERMESTSAKRQSQHQENGSGSVAAFLNPSGTKKVSRSSRRKKNKRKWLKLKAKAEREKLRQYQLKYDEESSEEDSEGLSQESVEKRYLEVSKQAPEVSGKLQENPEKLDQDIDVDEDVVPIVIRPGHIRFEPLSKVGSTQAAQQNQIPTETFQWNGTTSKKKGQKWGKEKVTSYKWNDYKNVSREYSKTHNIEARPVEYPKMHNNEARPVEYSKMHNIEARPVYDRINFEKLEYYTSLPKEGDVIAYRLLKLSSSWTPELSSYGAGKISMYEVEKNRVRLLPVPKYQLIPEEDDACGALSQAYPCSRDGSLWIDFSSLCDVRLISQGSAKSIAHGVNNIDEAAHGVNAIDEDDRSRSRSENDNENHAAVKENGSVDAWEQINLALNAKKAELSQDDNWNKAAESSGRRSWSFKALRGSAMGPTMAFLRAQNEL